MPPMARKTSLAPEECSQFGKKSEKTRPWKISALLLASAASTTLALAVQDEVGLTLGKIKRDQRLARVLSVAVDAESNRCGASKRAAKADDPEE